MIDTSNKHIKKILLVVNLGTPESATKKHVRKYLFNFLNDKRVIDLPWIARKLLVNLIIVPFRTPKSTKIYKKLWTPEGSPLLIYLNNLAEKLQKKLEPEYVVFGAMRYGKPELKTILSKIKQQNFEELIIFPLFPQYASSTTGSIFDLVMKQTKTWEIIPSIRFINQYYSHEAFIDSFSDQIKKYKPEDFDKIIFSYHGLPIRQINKTHADINYQSCTCETKMPEHGTHCYKATCYQTTRLLLQKTGITPSKTITTFQSRLSEGWLSPFTDEVIKNYAQNNIKKILIIAPSFVADCLETNIELNLEYKEIFIKNGGKKFVMVKSLNDNDKWVDAVSKILQQ
ncbi:MAG: ferrochelatase [Bacteroidales bacterium]|nr:ferrochelatase [Bacteroidales bacterium]